MRLLLQGGGPSGVLRHAGMRARQMLNWKVKVGSSVRRGLWTRKSLPDERAKSRTARALPVDSDSQEQWRTGVPRKSFWILWDTLMWPPCLSPSLRRRSPVHRLRSWSYGCRPTVAEERGSVGPRERRADMQAVERRRRPPRGLQRCQGESFPCYVALHLK